ncbi:MAG: type II toxin-antitoxin system RelE/ParE family toxin [Deltaproteobacteria bacterium]|nr:type II toxin-antitoxin system RelE/ParE family toxin [Deltaproteobacteria bacterium]MBW2070999.1 type II toxin-antitoxin system RelE/ParE family toxin [Deltaproteobacteria bacterium]
MKSFRIRFTAEAARLISKLHPENKKLIKAALRELREAPYSGHDLQEELAGFKSFKSKRYRIIYRVNDDEQFIEIYYVGHRKDIYEQFRELLDQLT